MREKAFLVFAQFRSGAISSAHTPQIFSSQEDGTDELAIFGGQTRVLVSKLLSQKSPNWDRKKQAGENPSSPSSSESAPLSPASSIISSSAPSSPIRKLHNTGKQDDVSMQDVHPSLMQYMSLFPASALSPDFNAYPELNDQTPQFLDQSILNGVSAFPQLNSTPRTLNYPDYQAQMSSSMQQGQSQAESGIYSYENQSFDSYQQPYAGTRVDSTSASTPDTSGSNDITELGMMMNGDSGIDEQWMSFMRESGIINPSFTA